MNLIKKIKKFLKLNVIKEKIDCNKNERKCFIMLAANYGNLGDIAITEAQKKFLTECLPNYKIIEVPMSKIYSAAKDIKRKLNKDDIITIIGGGNSGDIYIDFEDRRRFICKYYRNLCKIVSFPQTVDVSNSKYGLKEEKKSIKTYSKSNVVFFARERKSYKYYQNKYSNKSYLVPDIVLYLNNPIQNKDNNITLCLRNDKELVNKDIITNISEYMFKNYADVRELDTHIGDMNINDENKNDVLHNFLNEFGNSRVVITNRLHGMIFAVITGTPCIAFDNSNHKISETYNAWLSNVKYVKLMEYSNEKNTIDEINSFINNLPRKIDIPDFSQNYNELCKYIKEGNTNE